MNNIIRALFSLWLLGTALHAATPGRPNILFCLADDWSYGHAGIYGDQTIRTPTFDRVAREGMLFNLCFSAAPSCTPSRAAMLTGQYPHRLEEGSCLWSFLPSKFPVYPALLEKAGYAVGCAGKGWGPGDFQAGGFSHNPAGPQFRNFDQFLDNLPRGKPFCFWFGSHDPHRPYKPGSGAAAGLDSSTVKVPAWWPDCEVTRNDILDYYGEVERFDSDVNRILERLRKDGLLENTIVVMSGDNGWPFPRCKANVYDGGTRQPLAIRWPAKVKPGQKSDAFINLSDLAPTFLELAGLKPLPEMTGRSLVPLLTGLEDGRARDKVFLERERHANVRAGGLSYPMRAVRTRDFLYIRNLRPDRWPAGDPVGYKDPGKPFGDCDDGPTKQFILSHRDQPEVKPLFELSFARRPAEELYALASDPWQTNNLAADPKFSKVKTQYRQLLASWMKNTADPRATHDDDHWDKFPYYGPKHPPAQAASQR